MFKPSTLSVAVQLAQTLCNEDLVMVQKSDSYPVGVMTGHYMFNPEPTFMHLNEEARASTVSRFAEINEKQTEQAEAEYDTLVDLMASGIERMLVTARTNIAPVIAGYAETYKSTISVGMVPSIEVIPYNYKAIHSETALVEHLMSSYDGIKQLESYRTFKIEYPGIEKIVEWAAHNQHASAETIKAWALNLPEDTIQSVWYSLFGGERQIYPDNIWAFSRSGRPDNVDSLLLGYFLTIYLNHEPQDVVGESVSLEEWEEAFKYLHRYLGALLRSTYIQRSHEKVRRRVVLKSVFTNDRYTTELKVWVNGDVFQDWLADGGDVKQVLGAAVSAPQMQYAEDLDGAKADLVSTWDRKHYLLKQTAADRTSSRRRRVVSDIVTNRYAIQDENTGSELPKLDVDVVAKRVKEQLALKSDKDFDDPETLFKDLVCDVYYPNTPYKEFLTRMAKVSTEQGLNPRDAALFATVEMVAAWLSDQVVVECYEEDIRRTEIVAEGSSPEPATVEEVINDADVSTAA